MKKIIVSICISIIILASTSNAVKVSAYSNAVYGYSQAENYRWVSNHGWESNTIARYTYGYSYANVVSTSYGESRTYYRGQTACAYAYGGAGSDISHHHYFYH